MPNPITPSKRITPASATTTATKRTHSPFASLIQRHNDATTNNHHHSPRRPSQKPATSGQGVGQGVARQDDFDDSTDPISSPSPSPPPCSQVGLSVEVPDYLPTQSVLDNIQHFKSSDHLRPSHQQQRVPSNNATPPPPKPGPHNQGHIPSTPTRQRRSMARTLSDIIPEDVSTQMAMEDIDQYMSTDHYRTSSGSSKPTRPSTPRQDRVRIISHPHTAVPATPPSTTTTASSLTASSSDSQEHPNKRHSGLFSPFKPLFPPPPVVEKMSPKRKSTPKKATPKKRQLQVFSVVDDTDPIEDGDSDGDWQIFWEAGKKDDVEGNDAKRHRAAVSPSTTPRRPVPKSTTTRPALKPPEPLGPKLLQISREEVQQKDHIVRATEAVRQPEHVLESTPVVLPTPVQKPTPLPQPIPVRLPTPLPQPIPVRLSTPVHKPVHVRQPSAPHTIPLEPRAIAFASKLTAIKDLSSNDPQKKYNIMGLIQLISPVQDGVRGFGGKATSRAGLTICDKGSIHLNITLWGDKATWIESCNVGDVVLLTDLAAKEYTKKTVASTRWSSMMFRMDGATLDKYRGDPVIEGRLAGLTKMRETLGHHLLDREKGIAQDLSLYQTLNASLFLPHGDLAAADLPTGSEFDVDAAKGMAEEGRIDETKDEPVVKIEPEDDMKIVFKIEPETEILNKVKIEPGIANGSVVGTKSVRKPEVVSGPTRGHTLRGVVVYHMLRVDADDGKGWEIGVVTTTKNQLIKVQTSSYTSWIDNLRPLRYMEFYGHWSQEYGVLRIDGSSRDPVVLKEKGPDVPTSAKRFESVKKVIDSRFMGIASIDGYVDGITFPDHVLDQFWAKDSVFSIPLIVCSNCNMKMEPLREDMSNFMCIDCQSDPDKKETSKAKWCYHDFHFWLEDKPTLGGTNQTETIRVSCKGDVGQQVFPNIPAAEWSESIEKYTECRQKWITWMEMLAGKVNGAAGLSNQQAALNARQRRVRVEVGVGKRQMGQAVRVKYLHPMTS